MEARNDSLYQPASPFPPRPGGRDTAWKQELGAAFTRPEDLLASLELDPGLANAAAGQPFPFLVPRGFARLMTPGEPRDPLLLQVLPLAAEGEEHPGFTRDPVGDTQARRATGLLQKYRGRALLLVTGACAVHCRYCFRRHFPYGEGALIHDPERKALDAIAADPGLREVILSGGDPLMLDDDRLQALLGALAAIPQLRRLRLHSRLPVVLPARITPGLLALLSELPLRTTLVVHVNHARELGREAQAALEALAGAGVILLNQSVLLRGVNADSQSLIALSEALCNCRVLPYYLHLLDPVAGAAHFAVGLREARRIIRVLRAELPGYLVPRLVREEVGAPAKVPMA